MIWPDRCYVRFLFNVVIFLSIAIVVLAVLAAATALHNHASFEVHLLPVASLIYLAAIIIVFFWASISIACYCTRMPLFRARFCSHSHMHVGDEILKILCICRHKWNGLSFVFLDCNGNDDIKWKEKKTRVKRVERERENGDQRNRNRNRNRTMQRKRK